FEHEPFRIRVVVPGGAVADRGANGPTDGDSELMEGPDCHPRDRGLPMGATDSEQLELVFLEQHVQEDITLSSWDAELVGGQELRVVLLQRGCVYDAVDGGSLVCLAQRCTVLAVDDLDAARFELCGGEAWREVGADNVIPGVRCNQGQ